MGHGFRGKALDYRSLGRGLGESNWTTEQWFMVKALDHRPVFCGLVLKHSITEQWFVV